MSKLEKQLREDRLLRDAAQTLFKADLDRVKNDLDERSVGKRALFRAKDGAAELLEKTQEKAGGPVGVLALLAGAVGLWFARNPILALLSPEDEASQTNTIEVGDDT